MPTRWNLSEWIARMGVNLTILEENFESRNGYPSGENFVIQSGGEEASDGLRYLTRIGAPRDLIDLYSTLHSASLPDVSSGYFIESVDDVLAGYYEFHPKFLVGETSDEIVVFGSDGGGALFAISKNTSQIYRLRDGVLIESTYEGSAPGTQVIFNNLR